MSEPNIPPAPRHPGTPRLLLLSAVFPGLGHLVAGRARWALVLAAPLLILLVVGGVVAAASNATALAARLFDPAVLSVLVVVQLLVLAWRLMALGAVRFVAPLRATSATLLAGAVAVLFVVGPSCGSRA